MDRITSAYVWATVIHEDAVPLLHLNKGDKFRWPHDDANIERIYCGRGWYSTDGKKFRTGTKTAVLPLSPIK
jgi:hypothetical protein